MDKRDTLARILAIAGTALIWLDLLAPLVLGLLSLIFWQRFRFDFLMPVELFMLGLLGGCSCSGPHSALVCCVPRSAGRWVSRWRRSWVLGGSPSSPGWPTVPRAGGVAACGGDGSL